MYWEQNPKEQADMLAWKEEQHMAAPFERHKQQRFEYLLSRLVDKYQLAGFIVELAQLLYDEGVSFKEHPTGVDIRYEDGDEFEFENEDLLMLTGFDFETLGMTIATDKDYTDATRQRAGP